MKPQSRKSKGRNAQKLVRDLLLETAPTLTENDIRSTSMGASGVDILMSEAALAVYPFEIEVKCQESLNVWKALEQAEENHRKETLYPLLCFKRNRSELYAAMKFTDLLKLMERIKNG